jgi:hypothetical protein
LIRGEQQHDDLKRKEQKEREKKERGRRRDG